MYFPFCLSRKGQRNNDALFREKGGLRPWKRRSCVIQRDNEQSITDAGVSAKGETRDIVLIIIMAISLPWIGETTTHVMDKECCALKELSERAKNNTVQKRL